jgi:hypothetical protein
MLAKTGTSDDYQWFSYRPSYFAPVTRVEWDTGTMFAALPVDTADYLVSRGFARLMTDEEIEAYTAPAVTTKPKKEKKDDPS